MARSRRHPGLDRVREAAAQGYTAAPPARDVAGVLLDSDVVIDALRGRAPTVNELRALESAGIGTYCCAVSWAEVSAGLRAGEESATEAFFEARGDVALTAHVGRRAGMSLARYAKSHGVDVPDALIAAAATTAGLTLWTMNRRHDPMDGVRFHDRGAR